MTDGLQWLVDLEGRAFGVVFARGISAAELARYKRTLAVIEGRFGLSLPRACLVDGRLPAHAVRGTPDLTIGRDPDYHEVTTWAVANGLVYTDNGKQVPPSIREAFLGHGRP
ncbi:hypothetical protein ACQEVM_35930 [Streptomyces sp. CA-243310]|uniref:hypothetical protein n=1 Tax=Streptomyces sp. CA-243310 TaxID=3240056 RepID=UPI003D8D4EBA